MDGGGVQDLGLRAGDEDRPPRIPQAAAGEDRGDRTDALGKFRIQGIIIDWRKKSLVTLQTSPNCPPAYFSSA